MGKPWAPSRAYFLAAAAEGSFLQKWEGLFEGNLHSCPREGGLSQGCGVRPGRTWVASVLADPEMQTRSEVLSCPRPTSSPLKKVQARMSSNSLLEILNLLINWRPCISWLSVGLDFCSKTSGYASLLLLHHCLANSPSPLHRVRCLPALTGPMLSPERAAQPLMQPLSIPKYTPSCLLRKAVFPLCTCA